MTQLTFMELVTKASGDHTSWNHRYGCQLDRGMWKSNHSCFLPNYFPDATFVQVKCISSPSLNPVQQPAVKAVMAPSTVLRLPALRSSDRMNI